MLTGMVVPTSSYVVVNGNNLINDMSKVRKNIGICLQHDYLFPLLTVKEHVEFFATVKGIYEENTYDDAIPLFKLIPGNGNKPVIDHITEMLFPR